GWNFSGWSGDLSGQSTPIVLTMNGDKTIVANFAEALYTLTVSPVTGQEQGGGTVTAAPAGPYHYGARVTLTATPADGYVFGRWGINENSVGEQSKAKERADVEDAVIVVTVTADATYTAYFIPQEVQRLFLPIVIRGP
ncbi:MAG: hypothetical protein KDE19_21425, partial [Caldilineaceae bacterium]|nr:hypothetical protein [Caldilineaceae bacterium]